jgi:hypothetical protein
MLAHVQGESPKANVAVFERFLNSPVTSLCWWPPTANEGVCTMCTDNIQYDDEFADDLGEATVHTEEAIRLLIKYRNRDGQPLTRKQSVQLERFRGSVEGVNIVARLLDVAAQIV